MTMLFDKFTLLVRIEFIIHIYIWTELEHILPLTFIVLECIFSENQSLFKNIQSFFLGKENISGPPCMHNQRD